MTASEPGRTETPAALRVACLLIVFEAALMAVAGVSLTVLTIVHDTTRLWAAFVLIGAAFAVAAFLFAAGRGLLAMRSAYRTPVTLVQLLAIPVAYGIVQSGRWVIGAPLLVLVVAVLVLLYGTGARTLLDHDAQ